MNDTSLTSFYARETTFGTSVTGFDTRVTGFDTSVTSFGTSITSFGTSVTSFGTSMAGFGTNPCTGFFCCLESLCVCRPQSLSFAASPKVCQRLTALPRSLTFTHLLSLEANESWVEMCCKWQTSQLGTKLLTALVYPWFYGISSASPLCTVLSFIFVYNYM